MRAFLLSTLLAAGVLAAGILAAGLLGTAAASPRSVVWLGLDYTQARFISSIDFRDEEAVVGTYPEKWNTLVIAELLGDLGKKLRADVRADVAFMNERNRACSTDQIVRRDGGADQTHLDRDAVARVVADWTPEIREGVGLGIVVDRLVKSDEQGCGWLAFVDLSDMSLLRTRRVCRPTGGFGFRNYYFNPFKLMLLKDARVLWREL